MALKRKINFGFGGDPDAVNLSVLAWGQIGGVYESGNKRWQMYQLIGAAGAAGNVSYQSAYNGKFEATMTIGNNINEVAGVVMTTVTENYYTLLRKGGTASVKCHADATFSDGVEVIADSGNNRIGPRLPVRVPLVAVTDTTAGGLLTWRNPFTHALRITRLSIDRTTKSTGVSAGDFGQATTVASNDTLIDGVALGGAEAVESNVLNPGTNGLAEVSLAAGSYITGTASATAAGLVGFAYIEGFHRAPVTNKVLGVAQGAASSSLVSVALDIPYA